MKKIFGFMIVAMNLVTVASVHADGSAWQKVPFQLSDISSNTISVSVDYQTNYTDINDEGGPIGTFASPWINITGSGISSTDAVTAVLIDYMYYFEIPFNSPETDPYQASNNSYSMKYDTTQNKFTVQADPTVIGSPNGDYTTRYYQEMAVGITKVGDIQATWYKGSDGNNYRFQMMQ